RPGNERTRVYWRGQAAARGEDAGGADRPRLLRRHTRGNSRRPDHGRVLPPHARHPEKGREGPDSRRRGGDRGDPSERVAVGHLVRRRGGGAPPYGEAREPLVPPGGKP